MTKALATVAVALTTAASFAATEKIKFDATFPITNRVAADKIVTVPKFNPAKGTLEQVQVRAYVRLTGDAQYESELAGAALADIKTMPYVDILLEGASSYFRNTLTSTYRGAKFAAFDGTLDYAGTSSVRHSFYSTQMGGGASSEAAVLAKYQGTGDAQILIGGGWDWSPTWIRGNSSAYKVPARGTFGTTISFVVVYTYKPN